MTVYGQRSVHQTHRQMVSASRADSFVGGVLLTMVVLSLVITLAQF